MSPNLKFLSHLSTKPPLAKGERQPEDKLPHSQVSYESPSQHEGQHCSKCEHYIAAEPPRCQAVASPIRPGDYCKRYEPA